MSRNTAFANDVQVTAAGLESLRQRKMILTRAANLKSMRPYSDVAHLILSNLDAKIATCGTLLDMQGKK